VASTVGRGEKEKRGEEGKALQKPAKLALLLLLLSSALPAAFSVCHTFSSHFSFSFLFSFSFFLPLSISLYFLDSPIY
jgi:hypothetical protein